MRLQEPLSGGFMIPKSGTRLTPQIPPVEGDVRFTGDGLL